MAHSATGPVVQPVQVYPAEGRVLVLEVEIALRNEDHPLVPSPHKFKHFTVDLRTAQILEKLATAVKLGEPCLLEGETSTSKTSSIEYLASVTGTPVSRLNLSGQTDTAELVGKYVPNDGTLRASYDALLADAALLKAESRALLERARAQGRPLSLVESQKVASQEGLTIASWRWQDGVVPEAMIHGYWLILDELNLAEAQVLERLNPVLERNPSLVLSEGSGERIGPGSPRPLHPGFRVFATMNPAELAGRSPLSPAYKDRFTAYKFVAPPTDSQYTEMMMLMVFGEQPRFVYHGTQYGGPALPPLFPVLATVGNVRGFLEKIAKVHATLEGMARERSIGRASRERLVFSRRTLIELLSYLDRVEVVDRSSEQIRRFADAPKELVLRALGYFYVDRIAQEEDHKKVQDLFDAIGLSERSWTHDFRPAGGPPAGRQIVPNLGGGTILLGTRRQLGAYRIGQLLQVRPEVQPRMPPLLRDAARLEVIGFTADDKVVVEVNGGDCFKDAPDKLELRFERIEGGAAR